MDLMAMAVMVLMMMVIEQYHSVLVREGLWRWEQEYLARD